MLRYCIPMLVALPMLAARPAAPTPDILLAPAPHVFVTDDVARFIAAFERLPSVRDTVAFLDSAYIAVGSDGLRAYSDRYALSGEGLRQAIIAHADDYAALPARLAWVEARLDSLGLVLDAYRVLYPEMVDLPVYFLVGERHGINSGSEAGPLLTLEYGAADAPEHSRLPEFLAHEVTHIQQFTAVGLGRYRALYTTTPSLLGNVVREGIADFVAELVTGRVTQWLARDYLAEHEDAVWNEFRADLCATSRTGWAGAGKHEDWPRSLGYALGAAIARTYYGAAADKQDALRTLLTSDDYAAILLDSGYAEARGGTSGELRAALEACGFRAPDRRR